MCWWEGSHLSSLQPPRHTDSLAVCRSIRFASGARGGEEMGRGVPVRGRASAARRALLSAWPASVLASLRSALARVHGSVRMCAGVSNPYPAQTSQASPLLRLGLLPPAPRVLCQGNPSAEQMSSGKERGGAELSPGGDQGSLEQPCCLPGGEAEAACLRAQGEACHPRRVPGLATWHLAQDSTEGWRPGPAAM